MPSHPIELLLLLLLLRFVFYLSITFDVMEGDSDSVSFFTFTGKVVCSLGFRRGREHRRGVKGNREAATKKGLASREMLHRINTKMWVTKRGSHTLYGLIMQGGPEP